MTNKQQIAIKHIKQLLANFSTLIGQSVVFEESLNSGRVVLSAVVEKTTKNQPELSFAYTIGPKGGFKRLTEKQTWVKSQSVLQPYSVK